MFFDEAVVPAATWEGFPNTKLDSAFRPFERGQLGSSATAVHNYLTAKRLLGSDSEAGLADRLGEVSRLAEEGIRVARAEGMPADYMCRPVIPADQPGFAFFLLSHAEENAAFPMHQLYAALALWLMWESQLAMCSDGYRGAMLAEQASFCLQMATGEGGNIVGARDAKESDRNRRAASARIGAEELHKDGKPDWELLFGEYDSGTWASTAAAVRLLAVKYDFADETVRKKLRSRKSALAK